MTAAAAAAPQLLPLSLTLTVAIPSPPVMEDEEDILTILKILIIGESDVGK